MSVTYDRLRGTDGTSETDSLTNGEAEKQEIENYPDNARPRRMQQVREVILVLAALGCLWIVLVTAWRSTLHPMPRAVRFEKKTLHCGNTTDEAIANGCSFDLLSHNWVAPPCLDPVTESEYRAYIMDPERAWGPFPYFRDREGKERVPDEHAFSMLANGHPNLDEQHVATTREEHLAHCNYLLRRTARAAAGLVRMNDENSGFWHTEHCLEEIRHPGKKAMDEINEGFFVGYAPCTIEVAV
jgi:hypothetical protein